MGRCATQQECMQKRWKNKTGQGIVVRPDALVGENLNPSKLTKSSYQFRLSHESLCGCRGRETRKKFLAVPSCQSNLMLPCFLPLEEFHQLFFAVFVFFVAAMAYVNYKLSAALSSLCLHRLERLKSTSCQKPLEDRWRQGQQEETNIRSISSVTLNTRHSNEIERCGETEVAKERNRARADVRGESREKGWVQQVIHQKRGPGKGQTSEGWARPGSAIPGHFESVTRGRTCLQGDSRRFARTATAFKATLVPSFRPNLGNGSDLAAHFRSGSGRWKQLRGRWGTSVLAASGRWAVGGALGWHSVPLRGFVLRRGPHCPTFLAAFGAAPWAGLGLSSMSVPPWAGLFQPSELVPFCPCGPKSDSPQAAIGTRLDGDPVSFLTFWFSVFRFISVFFLAKVLSAFIKHPVPLPLDCLSPVCWSGWHCASRSGWMLSLIPSPVNKIT